MAEVLGIPVREMLEPGLVVLEAGENGIRV